MAITKIQSESLNLADTYAFTGTVTGASTPMTPAFEAELGSNQTGIGDNVYAKCNVETEIFDTDNCYDNSTNYRFTPTTAGKYFLFGQIRHEWTSDWGHSNHIAIYKNGSEYVKNEFYGNGSGVQNYKASLVTDILDFNGSSDYVEIFGWSNSSGSQFASNHTFFGAYKLF